MPFKPEFELSNSGLKQLFFKNSRRWNGWIPCQC